MRRIFEIFRNDTKGIWHNFFALVVVIGLCFLPALYAWFNIYANWDPYGNTGNIKIAVVNLDEGIRMEKGKNVNLGDSVTDSLSENKSIGWVFDDDEEKAVEDVKGGKYYAAVILDKDFSRNMFNGILDTENRPVLKYYVNDKKNAVATKITDTAISTLQKNINENYVAEAAETVFGETNILADKIDKADPVSSFSKSINGVSKKMDSFGETIEGVMKANNQLEKAVNKASDGTEKTGKALDKATKNIKKAQDNLDKSKDSFRKFADKFDRVMTEVDKSLESVQKDISRLQMDLNSKEINDALEDIINTSGDAVKNLETIKSALNKLPQDNDAVSSSIKLVDSMIENLKSLKSSSESAKRLVNNGEGTESAKKAFASAQNSIKNIKTVFEDDVIPQTERLFDNLTKTFTSVEELLKNLNSGVKGSKNVFGNISSSIDFVNDSLTQVKTLTEEASKDALTLSEEIKSLDGNEQLDLIMGLLGGNPKTLSAYFQEPVKVKSTYIYEIKNYGSGVAPFYTTLAIWVGITILVSLIKVRVEDEKLKKSKPHELFLGRYLTFFTLSQIQTLIIVLGDLFLFKIQCIYPFRFWLISAVASLTFSLIVYTLTISFGDIGKAFAVVIMVIQIAGSGGTYPIEALPSFFKAVYTFFPFPYAIDAMRECIGGMYGNVYIICIFKLIMFIGGALLVGLVLGLPFVRINHFIEKRMDDTKML